MKILIVCESSHQFDSGGRVVRYLTKILKKGTHIVRLVVLSEKKDQSGTDVFYSENNVMFLPLKEGRWAKIANFFTRSKELVSYKKMLGEFAPDVIHFASFDTGKPPQFIREAKKSGAVVVLQPWTMHFFCAQGFGFRDGKKCTLCAGGNYLNAVRKGCVSIKNIPSVIKRRLIHNEALRADIFLSSNSELDEILLKYGISKDKIIRFPVPFDYTSFLPTQKAEENSSIFFGQPNSHKGLDVLSQVYKILPQKRLKLYPMAPVPKTIHLSENVEVVNGATWSNGLADAIAASKIILVPSLWSSSTEYSMCEALLFRKPLVVFNVGVHKHIFRNRVNAMVVEPHDVAGYAEAIDTLDNDPYLRSTIGENGYITLVEVNNIDKLYHQLVSAYKTNGTF